MSKAAPWETDRATATWEQHADRKPEQLEGIWIIRVDLVNLFQKTTLGIILVFRRLNHHFSERGA